MESYPPSTLIEAAIEIERRLTAALEEARLAYEVAKRALALAKQCPPNESSVMSASLANAADAHKVALDKYKTALADFNDFAINRRAPKSWEA